MKVSIPKIHRIVKEHRFSIPRVHRVIAEKNRDNIIKLYEYTGGDIPPNDVLMGAINAQLDVVVLVGYDKEGNELYVSSTPNSEATNWLLDVAKMRLMKMYTAEEETT